MGGKAQLDTPGRRQRCQPRHRVVELLMLVVPAEQLEVHAPAQAHTCECVGSIAAEACVADTCDAAGCALPCAQVGTCPHVVAIEPAFAGYVVADPLREWQPV